MSLLNNNLIVLPNLIILDWYLPDYNGSDFLRDFSKMENFGKVKIVILSSTNDYSVIDEINRYNIRFLKKPLNLDKLKDVIGCSNDLTNVKNLLNFFSK
jgi:response regulator of citrate/malate metabolism